MLPIAFEFPSSVLVSARGLAARHETQAVLFYEYAVFFFLFCFQAVLFANTVCRCLAVLLSGCGILSSRDSYTIYL